MDETAEDSIFFVEKKQKIIVFSARYVHLLLH